jgi:hypothetical protein
LGCLGCVQGLVLTTLSPSLVPFASSTPFSTVLSTTQQGRTTVALVFILSWDRPEVQTRISSTLPRVPLSHVLVVLPHTHPRVSYNFMRNGADATELTPERLLLSCLDISLLSGVQQLPPSARHGQQEDSSPPTGIHMQGKTVLPKLGSLLCISAGSAVSSFESNGEPREEVVNSLPPERPSPTAPAQGTGALPLQGCPLSGPIS